MPSPVPQRLDHVVRQAAARLAGPDARHEAEILLLHALGRDRAWLFAHGTELMPDDQADAFEALLHRREAGEPVAYLIGRRGFWTLDLRVTPDTLIPRAETERLVELALERLPPARRARIVDLGTGSGAIALAVASERPQAEVIATDLSAAALAVAQDNARTHGIANVAFRPGRWYVPLQGERFDLIASNPPYIADGDPHLSQGDLRHEPASALSSGAYGLDDIDEIIAGASTHLHPRGWLLIEHGHDQGPAVRERMRDAGLIEVATAQDLEGRARVTLGRSGNSAEA